MHELTAGGHRLPLRDWDVVVAEPLILADLVALTSHNAHRHWLVWSADDGRLLQTLHTASRITVVRREGRDPIVVSGGTFSEPLEARDPRTGELLWKREDATIEAEGDVHAGVVRDRSAVLVKGNSRRRFCVDSITGRDLLLRDFEPVANAAPSRSVALPDGLELEAPDLERVPARLLTHRERFFGRGMTDAPELLEALLAMLRDPVDSTPSPQVQPGRRVPSDPVARCLARLHRAVGAEATTRLLSLDDAQRVSAHLGRVDDDLLCIHTFRAELDALGWSLDVEALAAVTARASWKYTVRLLPIAVHRETREVAAAHPGPGALRLRSVVGTHVTGPCSLAAWLGDVSWPRLAQSELPRGPDDALPLPELTFECVEA